MSRERQRGRAEDPILGEIREGLGAEPDLVLWRIIPTPPPDQTGRVFHCAPTGWLDLTGILAPRGRWFVIEVKRERGGVLSERQRLFLDLIRSMGGFATVVRSLVEARAALGRARKGERE